jgi:hypothetical protein
MVHKLFVQDKKSQFRFDTAIVDSDRDTFHSLMEVNLKWSCFDFHEAKQQLMPAASLATKCIRMAGFRFSRFPRITCSLKLRLMVLGLGIWKSMGVLRNVQNKWTDESVLLLMKFAFFLVWLAETHSA